MKKLQHCLLKKDNMSQLCWLPVAEAVAGNNIEIRGDPPSPTRQDDRSRTYEGIAAAMAQQCTKWEVLPATY